VPIERPVALPADFPLVEKRAPIGLAVLTMLLVVAAGYAVWHYMPRQEAVVAQKVPPVAGPSARDAVGAAGRDARGRAGSGVTRFHAPCKRPARRSGAGHPLADAEAGDGRRPAVPAAPPPPVVAIPAPPPR
jgi:cytoskeleton protein RodZ